MKNLSSGILAGLALDTINPFYMIDIYTRVPLRYTTAAVNVSDLDYFTGETVNYTTDHPITGLSRPKYSNFLDREIYDIQMFPTEENIFTVENANSHRGTPVVSRLGFLDDDFQKIDGNIIIYKGQIDRITFDINYKSRHDIVLECSSSLSSLNTVSGYPTSREGWAQVDPDDTAFHAISETNSREVVHRWGDR